MNILSVMIPLGAFLQVSVGALAAKALASLGIGYISYVGLNMIIGQAITLAQDKYNGLPSAVLNIASMAGLGEGLAIVVSAITFRVALTANRKVLGVLNK